MSQAICDSASNICFAALQLVLKLTHCDLEIRYTLHDGFQSLHQRLSLIQHNLKESSANGLLSEHQLVSSLRRVSGTVDSLSRSLSYYCRDDLAKTHALHLNSIAFSLQALVEAGITIQLCLKQDLLSTEKGIATLSHGEVELHRIFEKVPLCMCKSTALTRCLAPGALLRHSRASEMLRKFEDLRRVRRRRRGLAACKPSLTFAGIEELLDLSEWLLLSPGGGSQSSPANRWSSAPNPSQNRRELRRQDGTARPSRNVLSYLPTNRQALDHFRLRAVVCLCTSRRALKLCELLTLSTTKVFHNDAKWPVDQLGAPTGAKSFQVLCRDLFFVSRDGYAQAENQKLHEHLSKSAGISPNFAHAIMSLICLVYLRREPQTVLRPWLNFHSLQESMTHGQCARNYAVSFWAEHCKAAGGVRSEVAEKLDFIIRDAWAAEREAEAEADLNRESKELDFLVRNEAMEVGLILSRIYELSDLEELYTSMGITTTESRNVNACCHCEPDVGLALQTLPALGRDPTSSESEGKVPVLSVSSPQHDHLTLPIRSAVRAKDKGRPCSIQYSVEKDKLAREDWHFVSASDYSNTA